MHLHITEQSHLHLPSLHLVAGEFPERFDGGGRSLNFFPGRAHHGFSITAKEHRVEIEYGRPCDAYRALGLLLASQEVPGSLSQECPFESVGVLWELSKNAVLKPEALEKLFIKFALMGINMVQLYLKDVFEIPGEPFFGYCRGAYTKEELRRIDDFGYRLGIEVIPAIQTLGHLEPLVRWPAYCALFDVPGVLMVGEEPTTKIIAKMLDAVSDCFRSRRIHVGMDEAHGVGSGNYLKKNGYHRPFNILTRHLETVTALCRERGLQPTMWSDMFFRIGSATNDYYDVSAVIPPDVPSQVPADVELAYWDYYHIDPAFYEEWIKRHRCMGKEPVFAAGAWTWQRFWAYAPRWRATLDAGMRAARKEKLSTVMITIWGDDGSEFHPVSTFAPIQHFAEWAYTNEPNAEALERQFNVILHGASLSAHVEASKLDAIPGLNGHVENTVNFSKWILWQDPVLGFLDAYITPDLPEHYRRLAERMGQANADESIRFVAKVARAVALKAELHLKTRSAWRSGDQSELRRLRIEVLPECQRAIRDLWDAHRKVWRQWYKAFGWEVIERRYAGVIARLDSLGLRLEESLNQPDLKIEEWEFTPLSISEPFDTPNPLYAYFDYHAAATPSYLK